MVISKVLRSSSFSFSSFLFCLSFFSFFFWIPNCSTTVLEKPTFPPLNCLVNFVEQRMLLANIVTVTTFTILPETRKQTKYMKSTIFKTPFIRQQGSVTLRQKRMKWASTCPDLLPWWFLKHGTGKGNPVKFGGFLEWKRCSWQCGKNKVTSFQDRKLERRELHRSVHACEWRNCPRPGKALSKMIRCKSTHTESSACSH